MPLGQVRPIDAHRISFALAIHSGHLRKSLFEPHQGTPQLSVLLTSLTSSATYARLMSCVQLLPLTAEVSTGDTTTSFLQRLPYTPRALEVVTPGMNTSVQASLIAELLYPDCRL